MQIINFITQSKDESKKKKKEPRAMSRFQNPVIYHKYSPNIWKNTYSFLV